MKKLVLALAFMLLLAPVVFAAERDLTISLYESVNQTLEVTTTNVLSGENWRRDLKNALKDHVVVAKEVAKVVFPDCKEFSITLNTKIAAGLTNYTTTSQITCSQPSP